MYVCSGEEQSELGEALRSANTHSTFEMPLSASETRSCVLCKGAFFFCINSVLKATCFNSLAFLQVNINHGKCLY